MTDSNQLIPFDQREVAFYEGTVIAVRTQSGGVFVPIRPICDNLGIDWSGQRQRIQRDPVLATVAASIPVTHVEPDRTRQIEMLCLPLDYLNGWLFGIAANRIKDNAIRDRLIQYQRDCYQVLAEAFGNNRVTHAPDPDLADLLASDDPSAQAYRMAMAIANMARQQLLLRSQVASNTDRIEAIEARLGDAARFVTTDQATHIAQAVRAIAMELGRRSGRNEFGGVWGELYRQYQVPSYRELPAAQYVPVMAFLRRWWQSLVDDGDAPF